MEDRRRGNAEMAEDIKEIKESVDKIWHILNGNGTPGLVAKIDVHDKQIHHWIGLNTFIITTILSAIILGVSSFVFWKLNMQPGG